MILFRDVATYFCRSLSLYDKKKTVLRNLHFVCHPYIFWVVNIDARYLFECKISGLGLL